MSLKITCEEDAKPEDIQILIDGINSYSAKKPTGGARRDLTFFLRDAEGAIVGGVHGNSGWGWLYISDLWVSETLRGGGYGTALMLKAEQEARRRGCQNIYLNTFSFQAIDFYQKLGYTIYAQLEDFPPGHKLVSLRKKLT
jgi:GNAT superfamily N-acetyltransferase